MQILHLLPPRLNHSNAFFVSRWFTTNWPWIGSGVNGLALLVFFIQKIYVKVMVLHLGIVGKAQGIGSTGKL